MFFKFKSLLLVCFYVLKIVSYSNGHYEAQDVSNQTRISPELLKQALWRRCSNNRYLTCAKLALVHVIEKLDSSENYLLLPGISLQHAGQQQQINDADNNNSSSAKVNEATVESAAMGKSFNEALNRYLMLKIKRYLGSLTLSVKLLDKNTVDDARSFGEMIFGSPMMEEGRGRKKYMQSLLVAAWMSGATLLALTLKTIAILSGKALLAALLSLMLSIVSAFSKGHAETKSTTYEIITKPIVAHSHSSELHEAHPSEQHGLTYRRSVNLENVLGALKSPRELVFGHDDDDNNEDEIQDDVDKVIYKIHRYSDKDSPPYQYQAPIYTPETS